MVAFTNCKINIGLDVVRKRPDGYHDIDTCMYPIPWHDVVEIIPSDDGETTLTVYGNKVDCPPEKNLVMKAYNKLKAEYDLPPVHIILQKIVPDGAGLGGGSSDAAHTLRLLNEMFDLGISREHLAQIASTIGADCAFFVYDQPMMARGIGEILSPIDIDLAGYTIVIAKPASVNISTREAYAGIKPAYPDVQLDELLSQDITTWQGRVKNDFETSIFALAPQIAQLKQTMIDSGAVYASMSGSGASVYGIFQSDKLTDATIAKFANMPHFVHHIK